MSGRTDWDNGFIAVDWGTTNRRAYLVEHGSRHSREFEDGQGILAVGRGGFEAAVEQISDRLGDHPLLLAGMIGSNRGWMEAPYVPCPAGLDDLARGLVWPVEGAAAIVPGVCYSNGRADVMRGEEVQIFGALSSGDIPGECIVCHPGTHNKWIRVSNGRIHSFRTVMTGELFNLLRDRSILSDLLDGTAQAGDAFSDGVRQGLSGTGVTALLFEARARFLLGRLDKADAASFVSGLLIGEDVRIGLTANRDLPLVVMGQPELTSLYTSALALAGAASDEVDGEKSFVTGACRIVERIR
jgi:2-dehydro-3-deoxygalactonokinase